MLGSLKRSVGYRAPFIEDFRLRRFYKTLAHEISGDAAEPLSAADVTPTERDEAIAARLLRAFRAADAKARESTAPEHDIWTEIRAAQGQYLGLLEHGEPRELAAYLCNMYRTDATIGTAQGRAEYVRLSMSRAYRRFYSLMIKDKLLSFAEAAGAIPCENPEQGEWGRSMQRPAAEMFDLLERKLGQDLRPADVDGGLFKLDAGKAKLNDRDLHGQFIAYRLAMMSHPKPRSVCEIGGGVGRLAYWSTRFGIERYAIVDLPHINVLQGFYLLRTLPDVAIGLYGEEQAGCSIRLVPSFALDALDGWDIDAVVAVDSLPEIAPAIVDQYLRWVRRSTRRFVSVNQESRPPMVSGAPQLNVPEAIRAVGGFTLTERTPYWLRKGYVFEEYDVAADARGATTAARSGAGEAAVALRHA